MKTLTLEVRLKTPCLIGSGTGYGPLIDSDIVFDDCGIPYIPAKRIKGCLRDSATEVLEYFSLAQVNLLDLSRMGDNFTLVLKTFGGPGERSPAGVYFNNLMINEYEQTQAWLRYLLSNNKLLSREDVINFFTEIRQQTAIDENKGVAKEHSLRTIRAAKNNLTFKGEIDIEEDDPAISKLLYFAAKNLRHIGTRRTRGFGLVECRLLDGEKELDYLKELEEV